MSGPEDATDGGKWGTLWQSGQDLAAALQRHSQDVAAKIQVQAHDLANQVSSVEWGDKVTTAVQQAAETLHRATAAVDSPTEKAIRRNSVIQLADRVFIIPFPEKNRAASIAAALPGNCKIFNMSERRYDPSEVFPTMSVVVEDITFPGLPYPPLIETAQICLQIEEWLSADQTRCVALHCIPSGLPTRTAVVSACLLFWLFPADYSHPLEAVPRVCKALRLKEEDLLPNTTPLANSSSKVGWRPYLDLWQQGRKLYSSWEPVGDHSAPAKRSRVDEPVLTFTIPNGGIPVSEDVILRLRTYPGPHTVFRVPLPCPGVLYHDQATRISLTRADLDSGVLSEFVDNVEVLLSFDEDITKGGGSTSRSGHEKEKESLGDSHRSQGEAVVSDGEISAEVTSAVEPRVAETEQPPADSEGGTEAGVGSSHEGEMTIPLESPVDDADLGLEDLYGLTEVDYTSWDVPDGNSPEHGL
ncbi:hypothetical protein Pmar_PMAR013470 [Perkinsus marinus ATCC 50983]|uniref:Uncharacterized protein n=1 Tax=Perkinsus marinus (strain ATCC 50983 / TXsc) TaxID=423536 RepID=C5L1X7_PERM5|nr:hypothetical protein Pmar_PMAR013470 [Perkinsus marinus ATCC 50983]EER09246.1 hypothetical protein Pmar_PMAR013470 [Perkinsus marinus ATCC 50983]|eukprot:XP_002777430.1 hypothetical protein Pmar_PMAR013470 [Perkinsus marinus ATCC 50983]